MVLVGLAILFQIAVPIHAVLEVHAHPACVEADHFHAPCPDEPDSVCPACRALQSQHAVPVEAPACAAAFDLVAVRAPAPALPRATAERHDRPIRAPPAA